MQPNIRFSGYGAIVAIVYMTIISSLDDISRLIIVCSLVALVFISEKRAKALNRPCCYSTLEYI
jgi:hypothetical protein